MNRFSVRVVAIVGLLVCAVALPASGATFSKSPLAPTDGVFTPPREAPGGTCGTTTITQSASQNLVAGNSVACQASGLSAANSYYRVFNLADYGFSGFDVCSVDIGIESADSVTGIPIPIEVRLYTTPTGTFPGGALTPIGSAPSSLVAGTTLTIVEIPVAGFLSVPDDLVVEIFTPDGLTDGWGIWLGSNDLGESGPSYIAAPDCGIVTPTPTADIGFPGMHLVMNVNGTPAASNCCTDWGGLGCDDPTCEARVCESDTFCCEVGWDQICADAANALCAVCQGAGGCVLTCPEDIQVDNDPGLCSADLITPAPTTSGDCGPVTCYPVMKSARGATVRAPVATTGPQTYPVGTTTIYCEEQGAPPASDCCFANGTPGCDVPACEGAVCAVDPFCCDVEWDETCAGEAGNLCGGLCGPGGDAPDGPSNCCADNGGVGCDCQECEDLICAADSFCCNVAWDSLCADAAIASCEVCTTGICGGASCSFDITVVDAEPPVLLAPDDVIGTDPGVCTAVYNYLAGYSDNCPGGGPPVCNPPSGSAFPLGANQVDCSATDAAGNLGQDSGTVTVVDVEPPLATAPDASIGTDDGLCSAVYNYVPGYADNCPGGSTVCAPPPGFAFPLGDTLVSCTATDPAGLQGFDTGTVTVYDDEAPVLICPADQFAAAPPGALSWPVSYPDPTVTDNCPGVTAGCAPPSGDPFPIGTTTVNCSATDGAGLTDDCGFDVTVTTQSIQEIPTASTLGLAALALLLAGAAFVALRRH